MSVHEICHWIQQTQSSTSLRESLYAFPMIEMTHVLALPISVGSIMWFDLRLLGLAMRKQAVSEVFDDFRPWMFTGFAIMFLTGFLLFWSHAEECYGSTYFRLKLAFLFLAGANVVIYHFTLGRRNDEWDKAPARARLAGLVSLLLWLAVITAGRMMAYTL